MNNLKHSLLFGVFLLGTLNVVAQDLDYLKKANEAFIKGNYLYAVTMYKMYYAETGKDISELKRQAEQCRDYLKAGDDAALVKDYVTAKQNYQFVLNLNPEDSAVQSKLSSLQNMATSSKLNLGQEYLGGRIAYIDNTGLHGFLITSISTEPMTHYDGVKKTPKGSRVPTLRELKMLAPCAETFKLCGTSFWAVDLAWKGGLGMYSQYYYIRYNERDSSDAFTIGKREKKDRLSFIYIKDF